MQVAVVMDKLDPSMLTRNGSSEPWLSSGRDMGCRLKWVPRGEDQAPSYRVVGIRRARVDIWTGRHWNDEGVSFSTLTCSMLNLYEQS